jgi:hypothetical protein
MTFFALQHSSMAFMVRAMSCFGTRAPQMAMAGDSSSAWSPIPNIRWLAIFVSNLDAIAISL